MTTWQTTTELLAYQARGVEKLLPSRVGALFMEMGTGKTRAAIELAFRRRARWDRLIWFCPVGLKPTIAYEWQKHTDLPPDAIHVFDDTTRQRAIPPALIYIVGMESMSLSARVMLAVNQLVTTRTFVVVDESDLIKGHRAMRTERITVLCEPARYRLILTGTPLSQGVEDLFAQMRFLDSRILGYRSWYSFAANHLEYHPDRKGMIVRAHNTGMLASKIAPYVYQVTKAECLDLPAKLYTGRWCDLTSEQRAAYQAAKNHWLLSIESADQIVIALYRLFTALQQVVCGFWTHDGVTRTYPHHRLDTLLTALSGLPDDGKVIVWTKYRRCVREIVAGLTARHGPDAVVALTGDVPPRQRDALLSRFRTDARYLVATPQTGGRGLTLNEASTVVFYTNSYKYSERQQAEDRCHRIGQTRAVTYLDIGARGSIDERIDRALAKKANLIDTFHRQVARVKDLSKKDVRRLAAELVRDL